MESFSDVFQKQSAHESWGKYINNINISRLINTGTNSYRVNPISDLASLDWP